MVVTLDADLQDDPAEIPKLLARLEDGFDLVSGWKEDRQDPRSKTWPSRLFNWVTGVLTGVRLRRLQLGLQDLPAGGGPGHPPVRGAPSLHPGAGRMARIPVTEIPVNHRARRYGRSKFGSARLWRGFLDLLTVLFLTRYTRRPLHLFGGLGLIAWTVGFAVNAYLTGIWLSGAEPIGHRPLLAFGVLCMLVGVQFFAVGLLSELVLSYQTRTDDVSIRRRLD